jgi:hypothetical protein
MEVKRKEVKRKEVKQKEVKQKEFIKKPYVKKTFNSKQKKVLSPDKTNYPTGVPFVLSNSQRNKKLKNTALTLLALGGALGATLLTKKAMDINNLTNPELIKRYQGSFSELKGLRLQAKLLLNKLNNNVIDEFKNIEKQMDIFDAIFAIYKHCKGAKEIQKTIINMVTIVSNNMSKINLILDDLNTIYNNTEVKVIDNFKSEFNIFQKQRILSEITELHKKIVLVKKIIDSEILINGGIAASNHDLISIRKIIDAKDLAGVCAKEISILKSMKM